MKYYKLTDEKGQTNEDTQWGENITHRAIGEGSELCTQDVIHVYDHPLKAAMFNPIHANFTIPHLWECRVRKVVANDGLKVGVKSCTTIKEIPLPEITMEQRVRFAIYCSLEVYSDKDFIKWANNWLNGKDRTAEAVRAAARAAKEAPWTAARAAEEAVRAAARAAWRAAEEAAWAAARAAAWAAEEAVRATREINFIKLIKKAMVK